MPVMTDEHKAALATGREEGRIVKKYLESLEKVQRNNSATLARKLTAVRTELDSPNLAPVNRLLLIQKRMDLDTSLKAQEKPMTQDVEKDFVSVAKSYSERKGISYKAWRMVGVPVRVLKLAQIHS